MFAITMQGSNTPANPFASAIKLGLCVPKQCSETDIAVGLQDILKGIISNCFKIITFMF